MFSLFHILSFENSVFLARSLFPDISLSSAFRSFPSFSLRPHTFPSFSLRFFTHLAGSSCASFAPVSNVLLLLVVAVVIVVAVDVVVVVAFVARGSSHARALGGLPRLVGWLPPSPAFARGGDGLGLA
jgi:hypothetical protein